MSDRALPRLLATARRELEAGTQLALATVIGTAGSTYRKAGARMLITNDGVLDGVLGGGCFDSDLAEQARQTLETGKCRVLEYDMRSPDDAIWGLGLGCEGLVRIFLQPLGADASTLECLEGLLGRQDGGTLLTVIEPTDHDLIGESWEMADGDLEGSPAPPSEPAVLGGDFVGAPDRGVTCFRERVRPTPLLVVCGAGVDAVPVVQLAGSLGWRTAVLDHRPGHVRPDRFPADTQVLGLEPGMETLARADAIMVMSHSLEGDLRYLRAAAASGSDAWLGVLGPSARRARLLEQLADDGEKLAGRLRGPVGLDLGGELPEEVALSILAEIQAWHYGKDAAPLTGAGRK